MLIQMPLRESRRTRRAFDTCIMVHMVVQLSRCDPPLSLSLCLTDPIRNVTSLSNPAWPGGASRTAAVLLPANGATTAFLRRSRARGMRAAHGAAAVIFQNYIQPR